MAGLTSRAHEGRSIPLTSRVSAPLLEQALLFTFVVHAIAMVAMATLLLPGMPGGGGASDAARVAYVAGHPWLWRLGWSTWGLTALSDLLLAVALLKTPWIPRAAAIAGAVVTAAAVVPDQTGQVLWMTRGVTLATEAVHTGDLAPYLAFEARTFVITAAWGAFLYTVGALAWTWCFAAAGTWNRWLTALSIVVWPLFAFITIGPMLPAAWRPPPAVISAGNAIGFVLMEAWFLLVAEEVLRRSRPDALHGRYAPWRHPSRGVLAWASETIANSRSLRALAEWLPSVAMESDITDVVYVNHLVEASGLAPLVPEGLELQRLGANGGHGLFTFLTFRHGHFGPRLFGPLRRLLPSPVQSNWRIHVQDPRTGERGVYFVTNAIDSLAHALAARLLSEGMPMHLLDRADVGPVHLLLDPGHGSAPDAEGSLRPSPSRELPPSWSACFASYDDFLAYCVPQDRALSSQPWHRWITRQEIRLGIPLESCQPLEGAVRSKAAAALAGDGAPVVFRVAAVRFRFEAEMHDRWP